MPCPKYVDEGVFQTTIVSSLRGIKMSNVKLMFFQLVLSIDTYRGFCILKINIKNNG